MNFSNRIYAGFFEAAPDAMILIDKNGQILLVNSQFEALFGYSRNEILNSPMETLLPERFRTRHIDYRDSYAKDPHVRPMGLGMELFGQRKSGEEFLSKLAYHP